MDQAMRYPAGANTMPDHGDPRLFRLHFHGAGTKGHTLPAALLVRAINAVQKIVRLLDSLDRIRQSADYQNYLSEECAVYQYQGLFPGKRLRHLVSRQILRRFELFCQAPEMRGFALPVVIGRSQRYGARSTNVELEKIYDKFYEFTETIGTANTDRFREIEPDPAFRELVVEGYLSALPPIDTRITLSIEDDHGRPILGGEIAKTNIKELLHEVIERRDLFFDNVRYQAEPPLRFQVSVDRDQLNWIYYLRGDFGIELSAKSRQELEDALDETLEMLWEEYAHERPERLSGDACELKFRLLDRIRRTT